MVRVHLTVHEVKMPGLEVLHEVDEGNFRRIRTPGKHRFPKKGGAERDAVEAADQRAIGPRLCRMGKAEFMQEAISRNHVSRNPRAWLLRAQHRRAGVDHLREGCVEAHLERTFLQGLPQTVADVQRGGNQHHTWIGRVPQDGPVFAAWPGEDTLRVRRQESLWM